MKNSTSTLTIKGQVTIPVEIRKSLGLKPRDRITFIMETDGARILPVKSNLEAGFGAVKPRRRPENFKRLRKLAIEEAARKALEKLR